MPGTMSNRRDDDLAYGDYYGQGGGEGDRGLVGDMGRRFFGGKKEVSPYKFSCALHILKPGTDILV